MSIVVETFLICDGACGENYGVDHRTRTGKQHRESAKREGWIVFKNNDYCPECVERMKLLRKSVPNT